MLSLAGTPLTLVGAANQLFVVVQAGHPLPKEQLLSYYTLRVSLRAGLQVRAGQLPLPLSRRAELAWVGFTDLGLPATADSAGVVRLLLDGGAAWYPVCDTRAHLKGKNDAFYVISVEQVDNAVNGVTCKTGKCPPTVPR